MIVAVSNVAVSEVAAHEVIVERVEFVEQIQRCVMQTVAHRDQPLVVERIGNATHLQPAVLLLETLLGA